ncbi:MAG: PilZ domain-containing protein [Thermodesulfobacteriota bacterium]
MHDNKKEPDESKSFTIQETASHPGIKTTKHKCPRNYPRTDLVSLNKIFDEKLEYLPVKLATSNNGQCNGMILDISENGCKVAVSIPLQEGEVVMAGFIVNKRIITTKATVRWITPHGGVNLVGIEFSEIADDTREFLRAVSAIAKLDIVEITKMKQALENSQKS